MRALVCPGQGSQKKSFLSPWLEIDGVREHLQRLSDAAGIDLIHYGTEAEEETIKDTAIAQPLIVAAGIVAGRKVLQKLGESKLILAGHSVGEITAAALAGVLTEEDAMRFVRVRATGMAQAAAASPTGMAAVLGGVEQDVRQAIDEAALVAANSNGAGQIVAAGPLEAIEAFAANPPARARVIPLKVAGAFHTQAMAPAVEPLAAFAAELTVNDPAYELLSNRDGERISTGREFVDSLVSQVTSPVRWDRCMSTLMAAEVDSIIEVAPAGTLVGLAKRAMRGVPSAAVNTPEDLEAVTV